MQEFTLDAAGLQRLEHYLEQIGAGLGRLGREVHLAVYAKGLFGNSDRKSMEPIAARVCPDPNKVDAQHQRLQQFITDSPWDDHVVRKFAAEYALSAMTEREPVTHWIVDDTGFLKKGTHSVGVKRQYTGTAGKVTNCQIGVSLSVATRTEHLPIDFELYLPREWTDEPKKRKEARIPEERTFKTKHELAIEMIERAIKNDIPRGIVLVDSAYGNSTKFRRALRKNKLDYAVAVNATTKVWRMDRLDRRHGKKLTVAELANEIVAHGGFRKTTWREGTRGRLSARFAMRRVLPIADDGSKRSEREVLWLLMEWEDGASAPNKFYFATFPKDITKKQLVRHVKQRWRTERAYQDMKGQLGLDHFEGRRFRGWHHHVTVVLACYAFAVAERARRFSPSARATHQAHQNSLAA